ncbi:MAG: protein mobD [Candidatus Competibacteraceae bacterium]|nr:protein mobD [Candidatus Competibacteraceae bacterium]
MPFPIIYVGGGKGGTGKSLTSMLVVHHLLHALDLDVLLVETDTSNPDVFRCYEKTPRVKAVSLNLDVDDGWVSLVNLCEAHPNKVVVVSSAARNQLGVKDNSDILTSMIEALGRQLVVFWVINADRDGVELLLDFQEVVGAVRYYVVRNLKFGPEDAFKDYNSSSAREAIEAGGGQTLNLPRLAADVARALYSERLSIEKALVKMPLGNRGALSSWCARCAEGVGGALAREVAASQPAETAEPA